MFTLLQAEPRAQLRVSSTPRQSSVLQCSIELECDFWKNGNLSYVVTIHVKVVAVGSQKLLPVTAKLAAKGSDQPPRL